MDVTPYKGMIRLLQEDLPLTPRPYREIGDRLGLTEEEVIGVVERMQKEGVIRRIGAVLYHQKAGIRANGMGVWKVPPEEAERAGKIMASFPQVTHCYQRPVSPEWDYNLYTMIHGKDKEECYRIAGDIAQKCGIKENRLLFSVREFKKTSMKYYSTSS